MPLMYRVRYVSRGWTGGPGLNTFYFNVTTDPDGGEASAVAAGVRDFFGALLTNTFPVGWMGNILPAVDVIQDTDGELTGSFGVTPGTDQAGSGTTEFGGTPLMMQLRLLTDDVVAGRRIQGRCFIGPVKEVADNGGQIGSTDAGNVTAAAVAELAPLAVAQCVWRRPRKATAPGGARVGSRHIITGYDTPTKWAILKSRRD